MYISLLRLQRTDRLPRIALRVHLQCRLVEVQRRRLELVKHEHQRTQQQDRELHRDLQHRVEHQSEAALAQRIPCEVSLHLALIGTEIRERQEEPAKDAGPDRVALVEVEREVNGFELAEAACDVQHVAEAQRVRHPHHQDDERREHPQHDHAHLVFLRDADGLAAAADGVDDDDGAHQQNRQVKRPVEDRRNDDRGRVDGDAGGEAPLQQK